MYKGSCLFVCLRKAFQRFNHKDANKTEEELFKIVCQTIEKTIFKRKDFVDNEAKKSYREFLIQAKHEKSAWKTYVELGYWDSSWCDYLLDAVQISFNINLNIYTLNNEDKLEQQKYTSNFKKKKGSNNRSIDLFYWVSLKHYDLLFPCKV